MNLLIVVWLLGTAVAAGVFVPQLLRYRKDDTLPVGLGAAAWLGTGNIAILFGALMVSFGAPDIAGELDVPTWLVVVVNHAANFGGFVGCLAAALFVGLPRWAPVALALSGVSIAVSPFAGHAFVPAASVTLFVFGALAAWGVFNVHVRVLAAVPRDRRAEAMGLILSPCLLVGVALVGVPLLGSWRLGLWTIAVVQLLLAVTYRTWKGAPVPTPVQRHGLGSLLRFAGRHRRLISGVCANFAGWVALYTIPSLEGASEDGVVIMAIVGQLIAAGLTPWVGRLADLHRRAVCFAAMCGLALGLVGTAVAPTWSLLATSLLGLKLGWWACGLFFALGEACGNFNQGIMEAEVSLADGDPARMQLIALAPRFLVVGALNVTLAVLSGTLAGVLGAGTLGVMIGVVCAVVVVGGLTPALRKM